MTLKKNDEINPIQSSRFLCQVPLLAGSRLFLAAQQRVNVPSSRALLVVLFFPARSVWSAAFIHALPETPTASRLVFARTWSRNLRRCRLSRVSALGCVTSTCRLPGTPPLYVTAVCSCLPVTQPAGNVLP